MDQPPLTPGAQCCPAHPDTHPSLSVDRTADGHWLLYCHAGCSPEAILRAWGLTWGDLMPDRGPEPFPDRYRPRTAQERTTAALLKQGERARRKRDAWRLETWIADEDRDTWQLVARLREQATRLGDTPTAWGLLEVAAALEAWERGNG